MERLRGFPHLLTGTTFLFVCLCWHTSLLVGASTTIQTTAFPLSPEVTDSRAGQASTTSPVVSQPRPTEANGSSHTTVVSTTPAVTVNGIGLNQTQSIDTQSTVTNTSWVSDVTSGVQSVAVTAGGTTVPSVTEQLQNLSNNFTGGVLNQTITQITPTDSNVTTPVLPIIVGENQTTSDVIGQLQNGTSIPTPTENSTEALPRIPGVTNATPSNTTGLETSNTVSNQTGTNVTMADSTTDLPIVTSSVGSAFPPVNVSTPGNVSTPTTPPTMNTSASDLPTGGTNASVLQTTVSTIVNQTTTNITGIDLTTVTPVVNVTSVGNVTPLSNVTSVVTPVGNVTSISSVTSVDSVTPMGNMTSVSNVTSVVTLPVDVTTDGGNGTVTFPPGPAGGGGVEVWMIVIGVSAGVLLVLLLLLLICCVRKKRHEREKKKRYLRDEENVLDYAYHPRRPDNSVPDPKNYNGVVLRHSGFHDNPVTPEQEEVNTIDPTTKPAVRNYFHDGLRANESLDENSSDPEGADDSSRRPPGLYDKNDVVKRREKKPSFPMRAISAKSRVSMGPIMLGEVDPDTQPSTQKTYDKMYSSHSTFKK